ncbi:YetF domain-containing protein [Virgibacillus oceani]
MGIPELLLRITIGFLVLFFLTRILGRKEISQLSFVNFVSAIAIGSIAADFVLNQDLTILNGVIALTGWTAFTFIMAFIDIWSIKGRKIVSGDPVIVIKEGKIVDKALRRQQLDLDALMAMLREKNVFSIAEVDYAIFEANGKLSVMLKQGKQPVTKIDMNIPGKCRVYPIPIEIIVDGKVIPENLEKLNLDINWVNEQLKKQDIDSIPDVFFAQVQTDGSLFINSK